MLGLGEHVIGTIFFGERRIVTIYHGENLVYHEGSVPSVLPEGYTRLQYIENPLGNSAYFNTNVNTSSTSNFQIDFMSYDDFSTTGNVILGGKYDTGTKDFQLSTYVAEGSARSGLLQLGDSSHRYDALLPEKNTRFSAKLTTSTYTVGSDTQSVSRGLLGTYSIYVFAHNRRNASAQLNSHGRLYSLKMLTGNTVVRNYIPCISPSNKVGVYDTINETFTQSASGTAFVAGPVYGEQNIS